MSRQPGAESIRDAMRRAGAVWSPYHGRTLARHFGDPAAEYEAATSGLAVFDRSHRTRLAVTGRAPGRMLKGILSGVMPPLPVQLSDGGWAGQATYHTVLTPKGRMITDLWATLLGDELSAGYLLDVPVAGRAGLLGSFARLLPPRFASVDDASERTAMVTLVGPQAAAAVSGLALGRRIEARELETLSEGDWRAPDRPEQASLAIRTAEVLPEAYSVVGPRPSVEAFWRAVVAEGARPAGHAIWSTLRIEAARPAFGTDMAEDTIPTEAGIEDRAIDHTKGCYTGQEVIVRIRDRGHVNERLRRLELGDVSTPVAGTKLFAVDGSGKVVGRITSAAQSPKYGGVVALAYVSRGVHAVEIGGRAVSLPAEQP